MSPVVAESGVMPLPPAPTLQLSKRRTFTPDEVALMRRTIGKEASDDDFDIFVRTAERTGLDPFARQIYLSKQRAKNEHDQWITRHQPLVSIDGFRLIAERTGEYEGQTRPEWCGTDGEWRDVWLKKLPPAAARVGVWRKAFREPLYAVARFDAFVQNKRDNTPNSMWAKMGDNQLRKCAEALALRQAFPQDLSGLYTGDEMGQASNGETDDDDRGETRAEARPVRAEPRREDARKPEPEPQPQQSTEPELTAETMTVEQALALPLPGREGTWGGKAGNPLGTFGPKAIGQIFDFFQEHADEDPEVASLVLTACKLIVNHRETKALEAESAERAAGDEPPEAAEDEQRPDPTDQGSGPAPNPDATGPTESCATSIASETASSPSSAEKSAPGRATTVDPSGVIALTRELRKLLDHKGIDAYARTKALRELDQGKLKASKQLQQVIDYWTRIIGEIDNAAASTRKPRAGSGTTDDLPF
jgi:phage recombination protein Bet